MPRLSLTPSRPIPILINFLKPTTGWSSLATAPFLIKQSSTGQQHTLNVKHKLQIPSSSASLTHFEGFGAVFYQQNKTTTENSERTAAYHLLLLLFK